jgi:cytochrome c peroxidase
MLISTILFGLGACKKNDDTAPDAEKYAAIKRVFSGKIDPENLANYANQPKPAYILKNNNPGVILSDVKATLGRVLFYDKNLSINNTISCGSCHQQQFAFSDTATFSRGVQGGITGRHSMRLVNARFANEGRFFWDERALSLAQQTTQPIKDHAEMGFSGENGRPGFDAVLTKLEAIDYYREFFTLVYNDTRVTEPRIQECLTQFILSIQSFDSKFDAGRSVAPNDGAPFPNFSPLENQGKQLFLAPPAFDGNGVRTGGGVGCQPCHRAPEFDIDPNSRNNGVIGAPGATDLTNTRSPSIRDLVNQAGLPNGPFMHNGVFRNLDGVLNHYNRIPGDNVNLDPRLRPAGRPQQLNLSLQERQSLIAFLQTLSGSDVYTNAKWSDPFQ